MQSQINDDYRRTGRPWATPSGLIVGGAYTRPAPQPDQDHQHLQRALLDVPASGPAPSPLRRIAMAIWRWL